jgi:hypothetical protein
VCENSGPLDGGLRSLVLEDLDWTDIGQGFLVVAITGALMLCA